MLAILPPATTTIPLLATVSFERTLVVSGDRLLLSCLGPAWLFDHPVRDRVVVMLGCPSSLLPAIISQRDSGGLLRELLADFVGLCGTELRGVLAANFPTPACHPRGRLCTFLPFL